MAKVEVELKKLHQILVDGEYFYQVPDYQRPYVCMCGIRIILGALIDDLASSYTNNKEDEYFCGSIVIAENQKDDRWDVVDGQQRLTSFIILACTILRLYKHRLEQKSKDFIEGSIYDKYDKEKERLKFLTAQNYNSIFENTVLNNLEFEDNIKKSELDKKFEENTYLRNAYYFKELLNESVENGSISDIDDFVKWFYEHIVLTRIICFEQDSAMQIFQVLNDRGQPLSPIDILKSNLMQEIKQDSEKRKDFITTWDKLVEACKSVEGVDIDLEDLFNFSHLNRSCLSNYDKLCQLAEKVGTIDKLKKAWLDATTRAKQEISANKKHYYKEKFLMDFGKRGAHIVSIIFTKSYYFDYDKQEMIEAVGIEKVSCNLLNFTKQNTRREQ
nr:DUF262 domain-containing protein [Helicobacter pylori]